MNWTKKAELCRELGLVNSTIQTTWKHKTKIISANEQNGTRIKRFRKPEWSEVEETLLKRFKQEGSDNAPMCAWFQASAAK